MKTRFIVNPRSGRAVRVLATVRKFAAAHGADVVLTERARHASVLAARALDDGYDLIVSVGGDGTMNEVASVLLGTNATLGLVPCGSGDGLGRHLGIHGPVTRALQILQAGHSRLIDTGLADGHPFFVVAGLGFEAEIATRFNQLKRRGFLRYLSTSARALRDWEAVSYAVTHARGREVLRSFTLAVANANQYGNNARIAPRAEIDDGLFDLCAIPPVTLINALPLVCRLFSGSSTNTRGLVRLRSDRFVIERAASGPIHTDGEIHIAGPVVEFTVRPKSLRVMTPT